MNKTTTSNNLLKRLAYCLAALCLSTFTLPATTARAEEQASAETQVSIPQETPHPAPEGPETQAASSQPPDTSYTYNEASGLWENSQYTWDPATNQTAPKAPPPYSYNPSSGHWDTAEWAYDRSSNTYVPNPGTIGSPDPAIPSSIQGDPTSTPLSKSSSDNPASHTPSLPSQPSNSIKDSSSDKGIYDKFYNALISNSLVSQAVTGDATVSMNTIAGDALSGDATAIATVLNLFQSTWGLGLSPTAFTAFTYNLFGDILGDLLLDMPTSSNGAAETRPDNLTVHSSGDAAIHNTLSLEAISGDASVTNNTSAGDATSGNATAIANIINAINSSIVSGNSFLGLLNIYGNLDGDILLPNNLIDQLIAANALGSLDTSQISNSDILHEFTNTQAITNSVSTSATTGDATIHNNTAAGDAKTGDAETNVTILNLTGREVIGRNALLVFVNVLGSWVGMIVNAPTGATSAALGGGIATNNTHTMQATTTQTITNDITVSATSGNALVANNTSAGDATSGNAMAAINILNMNTSQLALSDWFGVLFINVFGSWRGSFGIDTDAGTVPILPPVAAATPQSTQAPQISVKAFAFVPDKTGGTYHLETSDEGIAALLEAQVLSDSADNTPETAVATHPAKRPARTNPFTQGNDWTLSLIGVTLGASLLGAERVLNRRNIRNEGNL